MSASKPNDDVPAFAQRALSRFVGERYTARKKVFTLWGNQFHIYGPAQNLRFFVKQKFFTFKDVITVYSDETMSRPLLKIRLRNRIALSATYDISTPQGDSIGALRRQRLKNILRDKWLILDRNGAQIGAVNEDSKKLAIFRLMTLGLIPQRFDVTIQGQKVAVFRQHINPFVAKFDIDFSLDPHGLFDRRLGIASVVLLLAIQHSRG